MKINAVSVKATTLTLCFTMFCAFCASQSPDFRNVRWHMNKAQVKSAETATFIKQTDSDDTYNIYPAGTQLEELLYSGKLDVFDVDIVYKFIDDKLFGASYIVKNTYDTEEKYIHDFDSLNNLLAKKYGKPSKNKKYTHKETGDLQFMKTEWDDGRNHVWHNLSTSHERFEIKYEHFVRYSPSVAGILEESEKKTIDAL